MFPSLSSCLQSILEGLPVCFPEFRASYPFPPFTYALYQFLTEVRLAPTAFATSLFGAPSTTIICTAFFLLSSSIPESLCFCFHAAMAERQSPSNIIGHVKR